jgi:hypothetical protein
MVFFFFHYRFLYRIISIILCINVYIEDGPDGTGAGVNMLYFLKVFIIVL